MPTAAFRRNPSQRLPRQPGVFEHDYAWRDRAWTSPITYVALPFVRADDGVTPGEAVERISANAAVIRRGANRKPSCARALAFSGTGDPAIREFGDATLIRKFGDVPEDLSAL
jgi:hypothetical protein